MRIAAAGGALAAGLLVLAAAAPLRAETFKWVDDKGVTNYSNSPPTSARAARKVEERISVYAADPALRRAVEYGAGRSAQLDYLEAEWLQRQRYMMALQLARAECPYGADCRTDSSRYGYYAPYVPVVVLSPARSRTILIAGSFPSMRLSFPSARPSFPSARPSFPNARPARARPARGFIR